MLQIIGWLGCFYLVIKGLEIVTTDARNREGDIPSDKATWIAMAAWAGAVVFAGLLYVQGTRDPDQTAFDPDLTPSNLFE